MVGDGWVPIDDPPREARCAELDPRGAGEPVRSDLDELARAAADVHDEEVGPDRPPTGQPDQGQERLFLVVEDRQRRPRSGRHLGHDPGGVGEAAERLGAHDERPDHTGLTGEVGVRADGRDERRPTTRTERSRAVDGCTQAEERRFVVDDRQPASFGAGDQEVDRRRAEVDRGTGTPGHVRSSRSGAVRWCRGSGRSGRAGRSARAACGSFGGSGRSGRGCASSARRSRRCLGR